MQTTAIVIIAITVIIIVKENIEQIRVLAYANAKLIENGNAVTLDLLGAMRAAVVEQREQRSIELTIKQKVGLFIGLHVVYQTFIVLQLFALKIVQVFGIAQTPQVDGLENVSTYEIGPDGPVEFVVYFGAVDRVRQLLIRVQSQIRDCVELVHEKEDHLGQVVLDDLNVVVLHEVFIEYGLCLFPVILEHFVRNGLLTFAFFHHGLAATATAATAAAGTERKHKR